MKKITVLVLLLFTLLPTTLFAHSGGLDRNGCHHDRKRGGYHCHNTDSESSQEYSSTQKKSTHIHLTKNTVQKKKTKHTLEEKISIQ